MIPETDDDFAVTVLENPDVATALICLSGEIDVTASRSLSGVADRISTTAPAHVVVDLAGVTFASATLPNFLALLGDILPTGSTLLVCRSTPVTLRILQASNLEQIITLSPDLPVGLSARLTRPISRRRWATGHR